MAVHRVRPNELQIRSGIAFVKTDPEAFILANTALMRPPHVPEIRLHLADEAHDLWLKTEEELEAIGLPPPFWAFAWAGGQGLARYVLDHPETVRDCRVLDFASGSALVGIAARLAGAGTVMAADIDPWAATACRLNANANAVTVTPIESDVAGTYGPWDTVLAGDIFYDRQMTDAVFPWLQELAKRGCLVLVGDPGRSYRPTHGLAHLFTAEVPVSRALEDSAIKKTSVFRVLPE